MNAICVLLLTIMGVGLCSVIAFFIIFAKWLMQDDYPRIERLVYGDNDPDRGRFEIW